MERSEYRTTPLGEQPINPQTGHHYGHEIEHGREMERGRMMGRGRRRGMRIGLWFSAFAFGAAVGSALGLLFAPRRGSETRRALYEGMQQGQGVSSQFRKTVDQLLSSGRATPSDLISRSQRDLEDLRSQAVSRLGDARLRARILQKQAELRYLQGREKLRQMQK